VLETFCVDKVPNCLRSMWGHRWFYIQTYQSYNHTLKCLCFKECRGSNVTDNLWHPITMEEMYHFLGIILNMSIDNIRLVDSTPISVLRLNPEIQQKFMVLQVGPQMWCWDIDLNKSMPPSTQKVAYHQWETNTTNYMPQSNQWMNMKSVHSFLGENAPLMKEG
jgi:hypothetical protein